MMTRGVSLDDIPQQIGVPAWRGLSKTVGGASLKPQAYADGAPDSLPNQTPKRHPVRWMKR